MAALEKMWNGWRKGAGADWGKRRRKKVVRAFSHRLLQERSSSQPFSLIVCATAVLEGGQQRAREKGTSI